MLRQLGRACTDCGQSGLARVGSLARSVVGQNRVQGFAWYLSSTLGSSTLGRTRELSVWFRGTEHVLINALVHFPRKVKVVEQLRHCCHVFKIQARLTVGDTYRLSFSAVLKAATRWIP